MTSELQTIFSLFEATFEVELFKNRRTFLGMDAKSIDLPTLGLVADSSRLIVIGEKQLFIFLAGPKIAKQTSLTRCAEALMTRAQRMRTSDVEKVVVRDEEY